MAPATTMLSTDHVSTIHTLAAATPLQIAAAGPSPASRVTDRASRITPPGLSPTASPQSFSAAPLFLYGDYNVTSSCLASRSSALGLAVSYFQVRRAGKAA